MDYFGNRHNETFTFRRVAFSNFQEHEDYDFITGGSIEYATSAELKVTGSFNIDGYNLPNVNDLIRVYYSFADDNGEVGAFPLATLFANYTSLNYTDTTNGIKATGTLEGTSVLKVLQEKLIGVPLSFSSGTNAIYEAQKLIQAVGLNVEAEPSSVTLSASQTFDSGTSYLEIVNTLCDLADFSEAYPDAYGTVHLRPKANERTESPIFTFRNDDNSIMYPEIVQDNEWQNLPNVVRLLYNTDEMCIAAWASNMTGSRTSLDARNNREITEFESVSNINEGDAVTELVKKAKEMLIDKSADTEYVSINHAYIPVELFNAVGIDYSDRSWVGSIDNMSIELAPSIKTQTKIKRTTYQSIVIETGYTTYRG